MCRHLAYLGPPVSLAELMFDGANSLARQAWAPTMMRQGGTVNVDGFGVGWFPTVPAKPGAAGVVPAEPGAAGVVPAEPGAAETVPAKPGAAETARAKECAGETVAAEAGTAPVARPVDSPLRYRRTGPVWNDHGFAEIATVVRTGAAMAAVRSATVGMPISEEACAPFRHGPLLFSHNGVLPGWPGCATGLVEGLSPAALLTARATDSALLWVLLRARLDAGQAPADAVRDLVGEVGASVPGARLNLLLTDGVTVIATTWTHSLFVQHAPGRLVVASEPLDEDEGWAEVPDARLLVATRDGVEITPIHPISVPSRG
ncbi:class II glutamine amidotransferase domain-containing protein [Actinoalloteichus fjordicus]|uniref:Gamma-glutamyl-hercynylcysteine sulfoxide hydrolase n=1 Tax=Actinoalloteichus fjordicus TaxID=1612552 RepID=A0AAC9LDH1_9PSEU|nr:ergothioneine biosynthesis protein EgtC [Actinoalloteichus fjordicus]APU14350.1 putative glutamine amidotransferase [Actinoalloteichus fjordicus]